jgi:hypothetical protein
MAHALDYGTTMSPGNPETDYDFISIPRRDACFNSFEADYKFILSRNNPNFLTVTCISNHRETRR